MSFQKPTNKPISTNSPSQFQDKFRNLSQQVSDASFSLTFIHLTIEKLGTKKDTETIRQQLNQSIDKTQSQLKQITEKLLTLESQVNPSLPSEKLSLQKLHKDFETVLFKFQNLSKEAAEKSRQVVTKVKQLQQHLIEDDEHTESMPLIEQTLNLEIQHNESLIEEREQDIRHIEESIVQVNEIFRDLGTLVNEQQFTLDNIESNVNSVSINMENATGELGAANRYQKISYQRMCWIIWIVIIVILFIVLVII